MLKNAYLSLGVRRPVGGSKAPDVWAKRATMKTNRKRLCGAEPLQFYYPI
jgi:hypothetical protein